MKFIINAFAPVLAAMIAGQSAVALAQTASPQLPVTSAERGQNSSQDKKILVLEKLITEAKDANATIQSFNSTIASAKYDGANWSASVETDAYWLKRSLFWTSAGTVAYLGTRGLPELTGFEAAQHVNQFVRYLKTFTIPAVVFASVGYGIAIWMTIDYRDAKRQVNISNIKMEQVQAQIDTAKHNYNVTIDAIREVAGELNNAITENNTNKSFTISGLNLPALRNITSGASAMQFQYLMDGDGRPY